jgi:transcriptional regulator with XRE-family HTH domain
MVRTPKMFVSGLMRLLKALDIEQQAVAEALGSTETQVSLWAHDKRPVPRRQERAFLRFVREQLRTVPEERTLDVYQFLCSWEEEQAHRQGMLLRELTRHLEALSRLHGKDPSTWEPREWVRAGLTIRGLSRAFQTIARVEGQPDAIEALRGYQPWGFSMSDAEMGMTLVAIFEAICRRWGRDLDAEA